MSHRLAREDVLAALRASPLFGGIAEDELRELVTQGLPHEYPKHNILFHQGDPSRAVYLVLRGEVKVGLTNEEGKEVVVSLARTGDLVGLVSLLDGGPQPATAVTVRRSQLARFDGRDLLDWIERHPDVHRVLLGQLAADVRRAYQRVGEHALLSVKERLLSTLVEIAEREGAPHPARGGLVFTRPTHQELADRIGSSREVVSRVLRELLDSAVLEAEGKVIRVSESALVLKDQP